MVDKLHLLALARIILSSPILLLASSLSGAPVMAQGIAPTPVEAFGNAFSTPQLAPTTQARVYAYRTPDVRNVQPINVYLNGRYHASMLRGGYTEFCLQPGAIKIQTAVDDASQMHSGKDQIGQAFAPQAGQVLYLRLDEGAGNRASVQTVPEQQALGEIRRTARLQHTISRAPAAQECSTDLTTPPKALPQPAAAPSVPPREYALETDALFEFGKAELKAQGYNAMETLIQKVRQDYTQIERIRVTGYTDAIGPVALNKKLSQARADAVAARLQMRGLKPIRGFQAEGRWSLELEKTNCKDSPTPANKACHAPNRRVVILVYGLRR